jgi:hypothetical protein
MHVPKNTEVEEDITYDSSFMMDSIHKIGSYIWESMYWLPQSVYIVETPNLVITVYWTYKVTITNDYNEQKGSSITQMCSVVY